MLEFILAESCFTTLESSFGSPVAMMLFADWSRRILVYYSLGPFLVFNRWNTHVYERNYKYGDVEGNDRKYFFVYL